MVPEKGGRLVEEVAFAGSAHLLREVSEHEMRALVREHVCQFVDDVDLPKETLVDIHASVRPGEGVHLVADDDVESLGEPLQRRRTGDTGADAREDAGIWRVRNDETPGHEIAIDLLAGT